MKKTEMNLPMTILYSFLGFLLLYLIGIITKDFIYLIPPYGYLFRFVIYIFLTYLVIIQLARGANLTLNDCRIPQPHFSMLGFGSAVFLLLIFSAIPIWGHSGYWSFNTENLMPLKREFFESFFYSGFCSGIVEEMMFRGYIAKISENRWGSVKGAILPTLLFSFGHCLRSGQLIGGQILLYISISALLTVITYQSNSIWNSALVHAVWNICISDDLVLSVDYQKDPNAFITFVVTDEKLSLLELSSTQIYFMYSAIILLFTCFIAWIFYSRKNKGGRG